MRSRASVEQLVNDALVVQAIPAPTGEEHRRAEWAAEAFRAAGLHDVAIDEGPNAYGRLPGESGDAAVMVSAHLDTVFPASTDLSARRDGHMLYGPGIADNSMGLSVLTNMARDCAPRDPMSTDVWFVANAAEEGLGNLRGMRLAVDRLQPDLTSCIVVEGGGGGRWRIVSRALGSVRYAVHCTAPGGHSWTDFGTPSAVHELAKVVAEIAAWDVPEEPRTTYNVGTFRGGTAVNTIAEDAEMLLDMRSVSADDLRALTERAEALLRRADEVGPCTFSRRVVGSRPAGGLDDDHPLVVAAFDALVAQGVPRDAIATEIASTDANVPLAREIPAVTVHMTESFDTHRRTERLSIERLGTTYAALGALLRSASELAASR